MKRNYISKALFITLSFLLFISCNSDKDEIENTPDKIEQENITNLSEDGLANCYIVLSPGKYKFKADNQFNLGEGLPVPPVINPDTAKLIWQTEPDLINDIELRNEEDGNYVVFNVGNKPGNALIAVCDPKEEIEWSWHIWIPKEEPFSVLTDTGYELMSMNLGALDNEPASVSSYGLLYQWGRKDPFPAAGVLLGDLNTLSANMFDINNKKVLLEHSSMTDNNNNTLEYSISHPTTVLSNYSQYSTSRDWLKAELSDDTLWGNPKGYEKEESGFEFLNKGVKTCYDPSPLGWRVAPADVFWNFTTTGGFSWDVSDFNIADINGDGTCDLMDYNYGWHFNVSYEKAMYFPAAARFDGSFAMLMGSVSGLWGNYWSNSPVNNMPGGAFCALAFQVRDQSGGEMITVSPSASSSKADGYSIRCIRDN